MLVRLIIAALVLDLLLGDPRSLPHPVVLMGKAITWCEKRIRHFCSSSRSLRWGGALLVLVIVGGTYLLVWGLLRLCFAIHPWVAIGAETWLLYTSLAVKSLHQHAVAVAVPLAQQDLPTARVKVGMIVGRDTDRLDEGEVTRAVVETVAENTIDGIISPLFYAFLGGAPLALAYKAVNTLDSMVGYKEAHYRDLGMVAARFDDLVNWLPARLTGLLMLFLAPFTPGGFSRVLSVMKRDARKHPSPNGGIIEAGVAGALRVQLGGLNYYFGQPSRRATMGDPLEPLQVAHIYRTLALMYGLTFLAVVLGVLLYSLFLQQPLI